VTPNEVDGCFTHILSMPLSTEKSDSALVVMKSKDNMPMFAE
jgi:hypothetical protein